MFSISRNSKLMIAFLCIVSVVVSVFLINMKAVFLERMMKSNDNDLKVAAVIIFFVFLEIISSLLSVALPSAMNVLSAKHFSQIWNSVIPSSIPKGREGEASVFFQCTYELGQELLSYKTSIVSATSTFISTLVAFFVIASLNGFYIGLAFVPVVLAGSYFSWKLYSKEYVDDKKKLSETSSFVLGWLELLFRARREVFINWNSAQRYQNWFESKGRMLETSLARIATTQLRRELVVSIVKDGPYILCFGLIFFLAIKGDFSLGEAYLWLGMTSQLVSAGFSLAISREHRFRSKNLEEYIQTNLSWILKTKTEPSAESGGEDFSQCEFELLDGSVFTLASKPGIVRLRGKNGAGKSHLVETLLGLNDTFDNWDAKKIQAFRKISSGRIRMLERDAVLFPEWPTLWHQIAGLRFVGSDRETRDFLKINMNRLLPDNLTQKWLLEIDVLASHWRDREGLGLSSGERVKLAFARFLYNWAEDVKFLVSDECDAVLDALSRQLFTETLEYLGKTTCVIVVSHSENLGLLNPT